MIISETRIALSGDHSSKSRSEEHERLHLWRDGAAAEAPAQESRDRGQPLLQQARGRAIPPPGVTLSQEARALQPVRAELAEPEPLEPASELQVSLFKLLVERLTGRPIEVVDPATLQPQDGGEQVPEDSAAAAGPELEGWGMSYDYYASHYESEQTRFSAVGEVRTSDGQTISINLTLSMSREFFSEQRVSLRAGDALKDPLVVNFNGSAAELTQRDFHFDIDADGRLDQIAFVGEGSGLLALDRNRDGHINDGSELFGAISGDGFGELAGYDEDDNGWIDEADSIYDRLRVWTRDGAGEERLMALGKAGVGAIYLGNLSTPFQLKDDANELLGQVRSSGLYLEESGAAGTLQQIDLVV
ncbi:MAG: hypothetical protein OQL28_12595 [Sedimenticola sp.]|nr:hypothetical protein [Sedimenticola sp.]